jgi:shikimate kinase
MLNAFATHRGAAFAIDLRTTAHVRLEDSPTIEGSIDGDPRGDTRLIEECVRHTLRQVDMEQLGGTVETESAVPIAAGLKSSSAAANATVLATATAVGAELEPLEACRIGVEVAREVGVTVTGAFDDAAASMLGGVVLTDNDRDEVLLRDDPEWEVLVWVPPRQALSADAPLEHVAAIAPMAELAEELIRTGRYAEAMAINGLAYTAALGYDPDPLLEALAAVDAASLSGSGPAMLACGDAAALDELAGAWGERPGQLLRTQTTDTGGVCP